MKQIQSKMSSKNQIVIPASIRQALKLKAGDKIIWNIVRSQDKARAIAAPAPKKWADYTKGLGKDIWRGVDIEKYIHNIRNEWENQG